MQLVDEKKHPRVHYAGSESHPTIMISRHMYYDRNCWRMKGFIFPEILKETFGLTEEGKEKEQEKEEKKEKEKRMHGCAHA